MDRSKRGREADATETHVWEPPASDASTPAVGPDDTLDQAIPKAPEQTESLPRRLGAYELVRRLGRGGMGEVFEASRSTSQDRVALKLLPLSTGGKILQYFKREFRSLAMVHHPNLVGMHTLECDGEQWFLTMDLVDGGVDFLSYVRPEDKLHEGRLRAKLVELAAALAALHRLGIIHRDLKPGNVMVDREGRLVVLDFGLVLESKSGLPVEGGEIQGTPGFMSPQQVDGEVSTPACDWYAVGTMIYQAVAGKLPFSTKSVIKLLREKLTNGAPLLDGEGPADLCQLANRLLRLDPAERPTQAEIFEALSIEADLQPRDASISLIGRDDQLQQLKDALQNCSQERRAGLVYVAGNSGEGKSSLVEEFLRSVKSSANITVFAGRCYDRESVPFKALDSVIDGVCHYLGDLEPLAAALLLPDDIALLVRLFPVLSRVKVIEDAIASQTPARELDGGQVRSRAFTALRLLLSRIGRDRHTVVVFIDDLQWGDADSAEALFELLKPPSETAMLVVGAYRSDEMEQSRFLQHFEALQSRSPETPTVAQIEVGKLTASETRQLIISAAPFYMREQDPIVEQIIDEAAGNPYLTIQLLESLHVDGDKVTYRKLQDVIEAKLASLPNLADSLLKLLTVFGRNMSMTELAEAARSQATTISTLTRMRSEQLVRWLNEDDEPVVDIYHDKIRESVLAEMQGSERRDCHQVLAETIERRAGGVNPESLHSITLTNESLRPRVFDLSSHFDAAGETQKALCYGLLAAEQACNQLALEVAGEHYQIASRNASGTSDKIRYRIGVGYADVLVKIGRVEDASDELDRAESCATSKVERARIHALRASVAFKTSAEQEIPKKCAEAIRQLGTRVPRTRAGFLLSIFWEWLVLACAGDRRAMEQTDEAPVNAERQLTLRLINRLAYFGAWDFFILLWTALKGQNLARRLPESADTATACIVAGAGLNIMTLGRYAAGMRLIDRALEFSRNANDKLQEAHGTMRAGSFLGALARFEESRKYLSLAEQTFEELGGSKELIVIAAGFANTLCWQGRLAAAIRASRTAFDLAIRYNRRGVFPGFLEPWARASEGNLPFKEVCDQLGDNDDWDRERLAAEASWHSHHERYADAQEVLEKALGRLVRNPALAQQSASLLPMLVTAIRQRSESLQESDPRLSARLFRRALRRARFAVLVCRFFPRQIPHSFREFALLNESKGRLKKALGYAERSCNVAQQQGAQFEYAQSLLVKGRIAQKLGRPGGENEIATAEQELAIIRSEVAQAITEANKI